MRWEGIPVRIVPLPKGEVVYSREFEMRLIAKDLGYTYEAFRDMPLDDQAGHVAFWRDLKQLEAVIAHKSK